MNTRKEIFLDQYIVKPIAFFLNYVVIILGKILSINHDLDKKFDRIVICKFKGLGSIIQSTPMIQAIKKLQPNAEIIFVSTKSNEAFLKKISIIDKVIILNDKNIFTLIRTLFPALTTLIKLRPGVYIDLEIYSNFSTLVSLFSLSKNRIGYYLRSSSYKLGIYTHMMFFNTKAPVSDVYLQIARLFGEINHTPKLYPLYENVNLESNILIKEDYIVVNPNASDLRLERRWGSENFEQLINELGNSHPEFKIILIGSKDEQDYVSSILKGISLNNVLNFAGKTSIDELIILINNAKLVITNDSGPMHLSFACNTPTVCLFGPCSPEHYAVNENAFVFYKKVYCSPCVHDFIIPPCGGNNVCMKLINVSEVFQLVHQYLSNNVALGSIKNNIKPIVYSQNNEALGLVVRSNNA